MILTWDFATMRSILVNKASCRASKEALSTDRDISQRSVKQTARGNLHKGEI